MMEKSSENFYFLGVVIEISAKLEFELKLLLNCTCNEKLQNVLLLYVVNTRSLLNQKRKKENTVEKTISS